MAAMAYSADVNREPNVSNDASDLSGLSDQDLRDIARATSKAVRTINIFSETASRFIDLERRAHAELRRRGATFF